MKAIKIILALLFVVLISSLIGLFKGSEARHRWITKIRDKYDDRRQMTEQYPIELKGDVLLDEIELAAYHS